MIVSHQTAGVSKFFVVMLTMALTAVTEAAPPADSGEVVGGFASNQSRLVAASIFHPPRA